MRASLQPVRSPAPSPFVAPPPLKFPTVARLFFARSALSRPPLPSAPLPVSSRAHCAAVAARASLRRATRAPASPAAHPAPSQSALPSLALLLLSTLLCPSLPISPLPPPPFSPHLLQLVRACGALFPQTRPFTILLLSSLPLTPLPLVFLHLFSLPICCSCCLLLLMATSLALPSLPLLVLQLAPNGSAVNFPSWLNCLERTLSGTLVSGFNLWFVTQQSGSGAIPKPSSAPTSTSSDPYADGLRAAIAETERIAATAQATAAAAPDNAAARDSPRSASTPSAFAPSHSDLLAEWHVANARACQVILACLPPTLLPQCSHIRYAKDLLGYLTERFQSQTPISVIALLRERTSLRLDDFTTMADYIARVQTLSSQLASQKFELSDHVCGVLLLTGLTPEYSVHVTLYGERPADQWSFSRVSAFLLQAELNLRSCPPTATAVTPSSAPPPLPTSTTARVSHAVAPIIPPPPASRSSPMTGSWLATLVALPTGFNSLVSVASLLPRRYLWLPTLVLVLKPLLSV
ncbi:unnamed protein product [Closterium sp. Naga37s-1]|nr:unnamed protein product [Closterium sp. Naga37s-1]